MRRSDREIKDINAIKKIISEAEVLRIALTKDNVPYLLPLSFGFDGENFYFHTAKEGEKLKYFYADNPVCFELDTGTKLYIDEGKACRFSHLYKSVIGWGKIEELTQKDDKIFGLNILMKQYSNKKWIYPDNAVDACKIWKLKIEKMTGKQCK
ncbi:MAG TPA: pyridoxamine 5'-phosphate oxidase family protein [Victivallales bacterium]|nr:pyridoxamine 5'-phosphate oxidase family protein [Victivallales bacterium]